MIYVSLSRVQRLEQLFILEELPENKMKPWMDALEEMHRLDVKDLSKVSECPFKLSSMNILSLTAHFEDLSSDADLNSSDVLCLQETWLKPDDSLEEMTLPQKQLCANSVRRGAGIATYFSDRFKETHSFTAMSYQMTAVSSEDKAVINIYRSSNANDNLLIAHMETIITDHAEKEIFICADWNFCHIEEKNHKIYKYLISKLFTPTRNQLTATHKKGRCLDVIWSRGLMKIEAGSKYVYYSDHAQQFIKEVSIK